MGQYLAGRVSVTSASFLYEPVIFPERLQNGHAHPEPPMLHPSTNPNTAPITRPVVPGFSDGTTLHAAAVCTAAVLIICTICSAGTSVMITGTEHHPFSQKRDTAHHGRTAAGTVLRRRNKTVKQ